jgi:two-component system, sensor histidine kinase and response regulator
MSHRILVIEDAVEILENIRELLSEAGWTVHCATNGLEGVQVARTVLPDLILCDVMIPGCDGFEVLSTLRSDSLTASIPLLFLTARIDRSSMRRGMELGAEDYITKPFTRQELLGAVQARMERSEFLAEKFRRQVEDLREGLARTLPPQLLTPLNGILGLSSILVDEYESIKRREVKDLARSIGESGQELHRMIKKFLTYSELRMIRLDSSRVESLNRDNLSNVSDIGERTMRSLEDDAVCQGRIESSWADGMVNISPFHLQRLLEELLDNACRYSIPGAKVRLSTQSRGDRYRLAVENQTTEEFQTRLDSEELAVGQGLGVVIARSICELYGGTLRFESSKGEWTIAHVELPRLEL